MTETKDLAGTEEAVAWDPPGTSRSSKSAKQMRPSTPPAADRLGAIWHGKWWILLAAVVAAGLTLAVTMVVPKTFSSAVQVGLNASPVSGSSVADLSIASNNLAAQYAQVVTSEAVMGPAARVSGTTTAELSDHTASSTLASQNIIEITVQASSPEAAQSRANAVGASLVDYVGQQGADASKRYSESVISQLAPLDAQILKVRTEVDAIGKTLSRTSKSTAPQSVSAQTARLASAQSLLTALTGQRSSLVTQATLQALSLAPRAQVLGGASTATQVEPRPALYTLIAGVLGLVLGTQVVVTANERRQRRRLPSSS